VYLRSAATVCKEWRANMLTILFTEEQIAKKVQEMGQAITKSYEGKGKVLCVCDQSSAWM